MENDDEWYRLDLKTSDEAVKRQALWAGIRPGMRIADIGCGSGKTTYILHQLVQPESAIVGVDFSSQRIAKAKKHYRGKGIRFLCRDLTEPLNDLGMFDFIWVRFVLEYYLSNNFDIIKNLSRILNPGGILCLIDLDHNCLNHYSLSPRLEKTFSKMMQLLENQADFDPYAGRKLYSYLFDLGYQDIDVNLEAHHLIFGNLNQTDEFNWTKKIQVVSEKSGYQFNEYSGGYKEFFEEFKTFFSDPRRFTYTPVISCRGYKPME